MTVRRYVQAQSVLSLNWSTHKVYQECANCLLIPSMKKLKKDLTNKYKKRDKRNMQEKETKKINSIQKKIIEHALKKIVKMIKWYTIKRTEIKLHKKKGATKKEMAFVVWEKKKKKKCPQEKTSFTVINLDADCL